MKGFLIAPLLAISLFAADGNTLLKNLNLSGGSVLQMTQKEVMSASFSMGYIEGIIKSNMFLNKEKFFCFPNKRIKNTQAIKIIVKFLEDNPKKLHEDETVLIFTSLIKAFPCHKK